MDSRDVMNGRIYLRERERERESGTLQTFLMVRGGSSSGVKEEELMYNERYPNRSCGVRVPL